jgi:hypothetical protein
MGAPNVASSFLGCHILSLGSILDVFLRRDNFWEGGHICQYFSMLEPLKEGYGTGCYQLLRERDHYLNHSCWAQLWGDPECYVKGL